MKILKAIAGKKELRQKVIITLLLLALVNALSGVPTPGIRVSALRAMLNGNSAFSFLRMLNGAGLGNASLTFLSVSPYITASIILELLTICIPSLDEMQKDGEVGRKKFKKIIFILGIVLAVLQGTAAAFGMSRQGILVSNAWYWIACVASCWTLAAIFLQFVGEVIIEKKGTVKGISLILLCNVLSSYPSDSAILYEKFIEGKEIGKIVIGLALIFLFLAALFIFTVTMQETEKRFQVQYSAKMAGRVRRDRSYFPFKLWISSVVPVIFAQSILSMPVIIAGILGKNDIWWINMMNTAKWFDRTNPSYSAGAILYVGMIFGFSFFYGNLICNPITIADNLKKSGGTLIGVRPGKPTAEYIRKNTRMTIAVGA
ncbi:MAG: hypothetical protein U0K57_02355, partial [Lachnospiraceae bacterium]|nr:hypothetical protein [Lachnospiraceae bacterium]